MKTVVLYILMFSAWLCHAQPAAKGLYKSAADFLRGQLCCSEKHSHIKLHDLIKKNYVEVKYHDSTRIFLKKNIYGYADKEGNCYRFYNNEIFPILNPTEKIILYKRTGGSGLRGSPLTESWFFSRDAGSEIMPLTLKNIELAFSENENFEAMIETNFRDDEELHNYDALHKHYKLNRLLEISNIKTNK